MLVTQVATLMNNVTKEVLGKENLMMENLENVVDVGNEIFDANAVDAYVRSLVNHIGKVVFVDRVYQGTAPSVLMDGWLYGSILEKITSDQLPEAVENDTWQLQDGQSYDPHVFHAPSISAKFFNKRVTFEIEMSFTEIQIRQSFSSPEQLNGFISMIQTSVENSMTVKLNSLVKRAINMMISKTMHDDLEVSSTTPQGVTVKSINMSGTGVKAVNLCRMYNEIYRSESTKLTPAQFLKTPEAIRFAAYIIGLYQDRLMEISTLFNVGGKERFTPADSIHCVMLSEFKRAADVYLQSDTFHDEYTKLVAADSVPYWQGSGTSFAFADTSGIKLAEKVGETEQITTNVTGVICVMFDRNALGVANLDRRVTTAYNPKGEFYNNFYKMDAGYFCDPNENCVVFFLGNTPTIETSYEEIMAPRAVAFVTSTADGTVDVNVTNADINVLVNNPDDGEGGFVPLETKVVNEINEPLPIQSGEDVAGNTKILQTFGSAVVINETTNPVYTQEVTPTP